MIHFWHATLHYQIYRTLAWGTDFDILTRDGHANLGEKFQQSFTLFMKDKAEPSVPLGVLSWSLAGTLLLLLKWWLDNKMPYSPEYMDEVFQNIAVPGLIKAPGVSELAEEQSK